MQRQKVQGFSHVSVSDLFAFITASYETRRAWYGLFYHEPPARIRIVAETSWSTSRTFVDPAGHEEWLIRWALDKGYIREDEQERLLLLWTAHLMGGGNVIQ